MFRYGFLLLTSIVLARLFPDQGVVIQYEQLLLLGGSLTFFWVSGLFDGYVVLFRASEEEGREMLTARTFFLGCVLALLSSGACLILGGGQIVGELAFGLVLAYSVFLLLDMAGQLLVFYLLVRESGRALIGYGFLSFAGYFAILSAVLWQGESLETAFWALGAWSGIKLVVLLVLIRLPIRQFRPDRSAFRTLMKVSAPLGAAVLLSHSATYVDAYLIEIHFPEKFAIFRYGAKELPLVLLLANAVSLVRSGEIAEARTNGWMPTALRRLRDSGRKLIYTMFPLSILLMVTSNYLFTAVFGPSFKESVLIFDMYLLLVIPRLLFPQSVIRGHLRTSMMTGSAAIELVLNVVLSLVLMQVWGILGIAMATVIAFMVEKAILAVWCRNSFDIRLSAYTPLGEWMFWSVAIGGIWSIKYLLPGLVF